MAAAALLSYCTVKPMAQPRNSKLARPSILLKQRQLPGSLICACCLQIPLEGLLRLLAGQRVIVEQRRAAGSNEELMSGLKRTGMLNS